MKKIIYTFTKKAAIVLLASALCVIAINALADNNYISYQLIQTTYAIK